MSHNLLKGKKGIIFGALDEKSIAWRTALRCVEEGAEIVLTNAPFAIRMGEINQLAAQCNAPVIPADVTNMEDIENLFIKTKEHFKGGVDFILHSIGMSVNLRKGNDYTNLNYEFMQKSVDISAISFHRILQTAYKHDAINEWGSVVALSFIAAHLAFPNYNEMADIKAMLESITRSFGYKYGMKKKVRINTISQSPTYTTAGQGIAGFDGFTTFAEKMSPLGNASADSCAEFAVTLFSDYTRMITMQNIFHDGGFSSTGVTEAVIATLDK